MLDASIDDFLPVSVSKASTGLHSYYLVKHAKSAAKYTLRVTSKVWHPPRMSSSPACPTPLSSLLPLLAPVRAHRHAIITYRSTTRSPQKEAQSRRAATGVLTEARIWGSCAPNAIIPPLLATFSDRDALYAVFGDGLGDPNAV